MYTIRRATIDDIPILIEYRDRMFQTLVDDRTQIDAMNAHSESYFRENMEKGDVIAWVAVDNANNIVACAALSFYYLPPKPFNIEGKYGYIFSMYTEKAHRRKGLARQLLQTIIDYAKDTGLNSLMLHASDMGEALYKSFGFQPWPEMGLVISWLDQ